MSITNPNPFFYSFFLSFLFIFVSVKIGIFYSIFYAALALLVASCMWVFFQTLDPRIPKWKLKESLIGTNPGKYSILIISTDSFITDEKSPHFVLWRHFFAIQTIFISCGFFLCIFRSWFSSNATARKRWKYVNLV